MPHESGRTAWSLLRSAEDQWRCWGDEIVIRIAATGDTHHLGPVSTGIFQVLHGSARPLGVTELAEAIASLGADEAPALHDPVDAALLELERIGLVRRLDMTAQ